MNSWRRDPQHVHGQRLDEDQSWPSWGWLLQKEQEDSDPEKKHVFIINLAHSIDIQPLSIEKIKHLRPARCISHVRAHGVVGHLRLGPGGPFYDLLGDIPAACWVVGPPVRHLLVIPLATKKFGCQQRTSPEVAAVSWAFRNGCCRFATVEGEWVPSI